MGAKIPRPIRLQVIRAWLEGKSRDKIAQELPISTGGISGIIHDLRKDDPEFDLLREVAVKIKNQNMDIQSFAPLVRLYEVLREKGLLAGITGQENLELMQERLEALIVDLEVFFFKKKKNKDQLSIEDFVGLITNMYNVADNLGISLDKLPAYITELNDKIDDLRKDIDQIEAKKEQALEACNMTLELLQEYNSNKPFVLRVQEYKQQLAEEIEKRRKLEEELEYANSYNTRDEVLTWSIPEDEFNKVRTELVPNFELSPIKNFDGKLDSRVVNVKEMVMDLVLHPSGYPGIFRQIRDIYALRYKMGTKEGEE
jgi:hypothetical protein